MAIFPSATSRMPDLYNLIEIHSEITDLESLVLSARYIGGKDITVSTTTFTNTSLNTPVELDNTVVGTANFATNTESVTLPGTTLVVNNVPILFKVIVDGTVEFDDTDAVLAISVNGNLQLGAVPTAAALTNVMTLADVVTQINLDQATTGISATAVLNTISSKYFLRLSKDNVVDDNDLIIDATSTASILTDLGLTSGTNVIDIVSAAAQVDATTLTGAVSGAGPYNLSITDANGAYIISGTTLTPFGLTTSIDLATDTISITGHGFVTGDQVSFSSPGNLPSPLAAFPDSLYYVILVDANSFKLAVSPSAALTGTVIDLSAQGNDYFTVLETTDSEMYYQVWKGYTENTVFKQRMDEVIAYFEEKQYIIYRQTNAATTTTFSWIIKW